MKLHRYYLGDRPLEHEFWMDDGRLFHQWTRVLRYEPGREVALFNDRQEVRLYRILKIGDNAVHVELVTEMEPIVPSREVYLCFSLLKKDKNDWILQKGTELGVRHFVPIVTDRTEKTGFDVERAAKIVIEAAEQCERGDIPRVREPLSLETVVNELKDKAKLFVAEQSSDVQDPSSIIQDPKDAIGIFIGPEGGWSDQEKQFFVGNNIEHIALSKFTLRAETAAIVACTKFAS